MQRVLMSITVVTLCALSGAAEPPRVEKMPAPPPQIPIEIKPSPSGHHPKFQPLPPVKGPVAFMPAPPLAVPPGGNAPPVVAPPALPPANKAGEVFLDKLQITVKMNAKGVVEVVSTSRTPVFVLVARNGGLSNEVFVPGDTIYGFGGRAIGSIDDLYQMTQQPGWYYVEGIDNGANAGKAYIGRLYIDK